jgi:sulfate permease, SulP family
MRSPPRGRGALLGNRTNRFIVDAGAITDVDYSAAQSIRDLLEELARKRVCMVFARVNPYLRSDMDRHGITAAAGETRIFATFHEALVAIRGTAPEVPVDL